MDEKVEQLPVEYEAPMLVEVGEFNEDTLGFGSSLWDSTRPRL